MSDLGNKAIMAENIKYYMDLNNKSRNDMCEALGFKYSTFTDWVNGKKYPRIDKIEMIANYFGIEKSDLVEKRDKSLPEGAIPYVPEPMVNVPSGRHSGCIAHPENGKASADGLGGCGDGGGQLCGNVWGRAVF